MWAREGKHQAPIFRLSLLAWRKRIYSRDGFKNLNDLVIPRQRRNKFLLFLRHQRRRIDSNNFFVLFVKLAIFESIANGLPEDIGEFVRCAGRQKLESSDAPKSPRHGHESALYAGAHEGFDFRQMGKLRGTMSFGILQNNMEIDEILVGFCQRPHVQRCRSRVDFPRSKAISNSVPE